MAQSGFSANASVATIRCCGLLRAVRLLLGCLLGSMLLINSLQAIEPRAKSKSWMTPRNNPLRSNASQASTVRQVALQQEPSEVQPDPDATPLTAEEPTTKPQVVPPSSLLQQAEDPLFADDPSTSEPGTQLLSPPGSLLPSPQRTQPLGTSRGATGPLHPHAQQPWQPGTAPEPYEEEFYPTMFGGHRSMFSWLQSPGTHTDRNDPYRHIGIGEPLSGTSWLNRPLFVGAFVGGIFNSDLISGHVLQNNTSLVGFRVGWDFDHYWGTEFRYAFANPNVTNTALVSLGDSNNYMVDVSLVYYPLGDARWRPYAQFGMGQARFSFIDDNGHAIDNSLFALPFGFGMKYFATPNFTARLEFIDNLAFASGGLGAQNNISLSAGVEYRFGGKRPMYFPWHGGLGH